jgi:hypothetical protein
VHVQPFVQTRQTNLAATQAKHCSLHVRRIIDEEESFIKVKLYHGTLCPNSKQDTQVQT